MSKKADLLDALPVKGDPNPAVAYHDHYATNGWNRDRFAEYNDEPSLTRQEFAEDCDINTIMARYETTGVLNSFNQRTPMYVDLTVVPQDLTTAMLQLKDAETAFMTLPAKVRREFDNDPVKFVEYATDPKNLDQLRQWELAPPAPAPEPDKAPEPAPIVPQVDPPKA